MSHLQKSPFGDFCSGGEFIACAVRARRLVKVLGVAQPSPGPARGWGQVPGPGQKWSILGLERQNRPFLRHFWPRAQKFAQEWLFLAGWGQNDPKWAILAKNGSFWPKWVKKAGWEPSFGHFFGSLAYGSRFWDLVIF